MPPGHKRRVKVQIAAIQDLKSFIQAVEQFAGRTAIFRGLGDKEEEHTTLRRSYERSRAKKHLDIVRFERELFDSFKRQAPLYVPGRLPSDDWQWLALGRHYGLPTRLLDWSKNPLVSLYFAVAGSCQHGKRQPIVYGVDLGPLHEGAGKMIDTHEHPDPLTFIGSFGRFIPEIAEARLGAQQSVFTLSCDPTLSMTQMLKIAQQDGTVAGFSIWRVAPKAAPHIRRELFRIGMNQLAVFPDLAGLCTTLTWTWEEYRSED